MSQTYAMWQQYIFDTPPSEDELFAAGAETIDNWTEQVTECGYRLGEDDVEAVVSLLEDAALDDEKDEMSVIDAPGSWTAVVIIRGLVVDELEEAVR